MARCIIHALALCLAVSTPLVSSRRIGHDNTAASTSVANQGGMELNPTKSSIFVNGFEYGTDGEVLKQHFGGIGAIRDVRFQSRGSAVIEYEEPSAAAFAVDKLQGTTLDGQTRYLDVKLDERREPGIQVERREAAGAASGRAIVVSGFEWATNEAALENHFGTVGTIESLYFQSKVAAVVVFVDAASAQRAVTELDGTTMDGQTRYVGVKMDDPLYTGTRTVRTRSQ